MTQQFHFQVFTKKSLKTNTQIFVHECSSQHQLQLPKGGNSPICPSTDELLNRITVYTYKGLLFSHKENEILRHATTWMNPENSMLHERSQSTTKATYCMIPFV